MDSSRSRIDQFFPSRKRKPPSEKAPEASPKGSLDGFLERSPGGGRKEREGNVRRNLGDEIGSFSRNVGGNEVDDGKGGGVVEGSLDEIGSSSGFEVGEDLGKKSCRGGVVRRNLTVETGFGVRSGGDVGEDCGRNLGEISLSSRNGVGVEVGKDLGKKSSGDGMSMDGLETTRGMASLEKRSGGGELLRSGPVKRNLTRETGLSLTNEVVCGSGADSLGKGESVVREPGGTESGAVGSCLDGGSLQLKRFASDFLSLYCSELPSTENIEADEHLKGQKRNGSPSLLEANIKACLKKHCVVVNRSSPEIGETVPLNDTSGLLDPELEEKQKEANIALPKELDGTATNGSGIQHDNKNSFASLRRCNTTAISNVGKASDCTPASLKSVTNSHQTPGSACRHSKISPGDEFWDEAIHVADCLICPVDKSSILDGNKVSTKDEQKITIFGSKRSSRGSSNENDGGNERWRNIGRLKAVESCTEDKSSSLSENKEASPLPVKHFDFSSEGQVQKNKASKATANTVSDVTQIKKYDSTSLNHAGFQSSASTALSCLEVSTNKHRDSQCCSTLAGQSCTKKQHNKTNVENDDGGLLLDRPMSTSSFVKKEAKETLSTNHEVTTPSSGTSLTNSLELQNWLPSKLCSIYTLKGISKLYPWQVNCLQIDGVLERRNLVYCASTSAGKSFVAEILMIQRVISTGKMAILVLPYVSLCAEKADHLEKLLEPLGKHVRSFYGIQGGGSLPKDTTIAVCTIEKANSLVNRLLEEGRLSELGIIVIDELHMVGDQHRGYLLELLLTKLRYASGEGNTESCSGDTSGSSSGKTDLTRGLQVVGMSATMPNVSAVAKWLQAALYQTDFRPVPLEEYIKVGNSIFNKKLDLVRSIARTADLGGKDPDHIVELCNEIVQEGHSVLIFCSSRKGCESTAKHISKFLQCTSASTHECDGEFGDASSAVEALRRCPGGLDPTLEETLPLGVAYHHAGLTVEEREIVETCYRKGLIRVLTATSTLAAGVNLPARRVIFRQPKIGRDFIDGTKYRQMAGRAGRTGIDTKGESILICRPEELKRIASIINDSCPPLQSCLSDDKNGMVHAILEVVSGGIVQTATDIHRYVRCTLLSSTKPFDDVVKSAQDSLRWLCHKKFLEWNEETRLYSTTPLGRASFGSSLSPEESLVVLGDLSRAREGFVLASDLHLVYLVTPINVQIEPDWELYYERFMELSMLERSVGNRVGVTEPFLMRMAHGAPMHMPDRTRGKKNLQSRMQSLGDAKDSSHLTEDQVIRVSKRFYVALMLARLVQELPVSDVCDAFKVARGMIQSLQENAGRFASMVAVFCERLGWHDLEGLIGKFQNRVSFGVRAEIVELTSIPYVKGSRARALYKAGLRTPMAIAESPTREIAKALFDSSSWATEEGSSLRRVQLGVAKRIKDGARKIVLEKAEEARLAAFSAFSSLGVQVPEFPKFPLPVKGVEASPMLVNGINVQNEGVISHVKNKKEQGSQISARVDIEQTKDGRSNPSSKAKEDKIATTEGVTSNASTKESLSESCDQACIPLCKFGKDEIEIKRLCPSANLVSEGYFHSLHQKECMYKVKNDSDSGMPIGNQGVVVSEKGPINVGSFPGGFDSFMKQWEMKEEFYFDCHFSKKTKTDSTLSFEIFGLAICWEQSPIYYINLGKYLCSNLGDAMHNLWENVEQRWNRIAKIMGEKGVRKISWNLKAQIQVLKHPTMSLNFHGLRSAQNESFKFRLVDNTHYALPSISLNDGIDVSIVLWILWPDEESCSCPNLDKVVRKHLSTEAASTAIRDSRWRNQMQKAAHNGCCRRVSQTRALSLVLWRLLVSENLVAAVTRIENPLVKVLADMELWGIGVDVESCLHARHILGKKLKELEKEAIKLAGMSFSLYSTPEIANVLYARLKLPIPDSGKKGKQHPSTDKHSLELLRDHHPIIPVIREHRTLAKLLNSTLGSICSNAQLHMSSQRYLINGHWLQTSTATGRLSMEDPNLQCVEHAIEFRSQNLDKDEPSSSKIDHHRINARDFFIPTQDNWVLITADYSQIELRLMAHFSRDISLIQLLSKPEGDVFTMLAAKWTERDESSISSQERERTKRLVYGILYGMGANTLADQLDCSPEDAKRRIQSFKSSFPGVSAWLQDAVAFCHQRGYVETLMGRKRYLSKIKFGTDKEQSKAQRQAVNSICQGSAADIIKMAMINIHSVIVEGSDLPSSSTHVGVQYSKLKEKCRILLQVHDELLLEVDPSLVSEAGSLLQVGMETAASLLVPLHVKLKVGRTWGSLEPFDPES